MLFTLFISLMLAYVAAEVVRYFKIPRAVGQILIGFFFGIPIIQAVLFSAEILNVFSFLSDIAVVLLFFFVGMEIDLMQLKRNIREAVLISLFNTSIPFVFGFLAALYFKQSLLSSIIIGTCLSVSAQAISLDILEELKLVKTKIGELIITTGAIDDIFELALVSATIAVISGLSAYVSLVRLISGIIVFVISVVLFKTYVIPWLIELFEREHTSASLFMGAFTITLLMAALSEFLGFGSLIGAIVAGISVRELLHYKTGKIWEEHDIAKAVHVISFGFLVPIFLIWVGMRVSLPTLFIHPSITAVFILIAIFGTVGGALLAVVLSGNSIREGLAIGFGLTPKGDVELVIATLAFKANLISLEIFSALVFMSFVTTVIAPIIFRRLATGFT